MRIGFGYDIHRLKKERKLVLGGVNIKHPSGLDGHSDADVLLHAICDALLGAAGLNDIGCYFPNTDPKYKNVSSLILLKKVGELLKKKNYKIVNIDSTVIAEQPKIMGYVKQMKHNIASVLKIKDTDIGIKATTNEKIGDLGRGKGIASFAVALIAKRY